MLGEMNRMPVNARAMSARHQFFLLRKAALSAPFVGRVPMIGLGTAFPGIDEVDLRLRHRMRPRGLPLAEAYALSLMVAYLQPRRIFEIGTGTGEATVLMARQAPGAAIDTLDLGTAEATLGVKTGDAPLEASSVGEVFRGDAELASRVTQHLGDSARFDYAPFRDAIDLVFVDGAHTTDYVDSDTRAALDMASERAVVVWDDCHLYHPGVSRSLLRTLRDGQALARIGGTRFAVWQAPGSPRSPAALATPAA
jgi:predicted O-methyltransferase YrrM